MKKMYQALTPGREKVRPDAGAIAAAGGEGDSDPAEFDCCVMADPGSCTVRLASLGAGRPGR
jgi:hypothetical protein